MSAAQQAKAARRKMRNGYGHLGSGNVRGKPIYKAASQVSVAEAVAAGKRQAAREAAARKSKK